MNIQFPLLIDAGLSTEMERMGYDLNHKLWTSYYLESDPEALLSVHLRYLNAGAKCISTFSYQATFLIISSVYLKRLIRDILISDILMPEHQN